MKYGVCFTARLKLDWPHFKGSIALVWLVTTLLSSTALGGYVINLAAADKMPMRAER